MAKVKFIRCDMWKRGIYVFIGTLTEFKSWVFNITKDEWSEEFLDMVQGLQKGKIGYASYNYDNDGTGVMLLPKFPTTPKDKASTAHELFHATTIMLDFCQVEYIPRSSNETFAYLNEHLTRNMYEKVGYRTV